MDEFLKVHVVPILRSKGFKGSFPNFKRSVSHKVDILNFQFSQWSALFYINIGSAPIEGVTFLDGTHYPSENIKVYQCRNQRRIGNNSFDFENENFEDVVSDVIKSLPEAEEWWNKI